MNLPSSALRRPFTVIVAVLATVLFSALAWLQMPRDLLPELNLPTIYVAQSYGGMDPAQMEGYLVYFFEYHFLYLTGIEHIESKSIQGAALMKLQFHPGTDMPQAMAETVAFVNRARAFMPPGTMPPFITRMDPGSVPVGYLVFSSDSRSITDLQDAAVNRVRPLLATLPGVSAPPPFGGNARTVVVELKPERLKSYRMSPDEVVNAIATANVVSPSGNIVTRGKYPMVPLNSVAGNVKELEAVVIRGDAYPAVFVRDVAEVRDSSDIVTCHALVNGQRTVYVPITRRASASTLSVASAVRGSLQKFQERLPPGIHVSYQFDRSAMVREALKGPQWEALLGFLMTGLVVLLSFRNWRSAVVVLVNIPVALMAAILVLWLCGQSLNLMTLGGLALAVGILVDEVIVCLENIQAHRARGVRAGEAELEASNETTAPRLLAALSIMVLLTPAFFIAGMMRPMFLPLVLAVSAAVAASFVLSSTLVPVLSVWALTSYSGPRPPKWFLKLQLSYAQLLEACVRRRRMIIAGYALSATIIIQFAGSKLGCELFPRGQARELRLRLRAAAGTDVDHTEQACLSTLKVIETVVGPDAIEGSIGLVGLHGSTYPLNFLYLWNSGTDEAVLNIRLKPGARVNVEQLKDQLRGELARQLPEATFWFDSADLVSEIMALGTAAPIEIEISGPNQQNNRSFAEKAKARLEAVSALRDVSFAHSLDYPTVEVAVDRMRSGVIGADMTDISRALVPATWSSRFQSPSFWSDPASGVAYQVQTQIPQDQLHSLEQLRDLTVVERRGQLIPLRSVARITEGVPKKSRYDRYNMQRTLTVMANLSGEPLSRAALQLKQAMKELGAPPPGVNVAVRGQVSALGELQHEATLGLALAIAGVFLLLLANFQSARLALVVLCAVPGVLAGVGAALVLQGATLNVLSIAGMTMTLGVGLANAILLITFAEGMRKAGVPAEKAALDSSRQRLRPILMTSSAMFAGMLPVALGWSDSTRQMAPLGSAVIGGVVGGTITTLLVLPLIFSWVQARTHRREAALYLPEPHA